MATDFFDETLAILRAATENVKRARQPIVVDERYKTATVTPERLEELMQSLATRKKSL